VSTTTAPPSQSLHRPVFTVLGVISLCHLLHDMMQALLPSMYPLLKVNYHLSFGQIGLLTLTYQFTASLLQPLVGWYTDRHPQPYSLTIGMGVTLVGLLLLASAHRFEVLLVAAAFIGMGSSVFHPESSRVARRASGGQHGLAQSLFQVGGNTGSAIGPLAAAFIILPFGQSSLAWFALAALTAAALLWGIGGWYRRNTPPRPVSSTTKLHIHPGLTRRQVAVSMAILLSLIFSKYFYLVSLTSYYTFYLIQKFHVSMQSAQLYLFLFLGAAAAGTLVGGPVGDRLGRKYVIWVSILGVLPFTLLLPYVNLFWTAALSVLIGFIIASAFSAILVYAQELLPGNVGMVSGLFFGFAFGMAGVGAAVLGWLADRTSITFVYHVCAYLPAVGLLTGFLPDLERIGGTERADTAPEVVAAS